MKEITENLHYIIWLQPASMTKTALLSKWLGCDEQHAENLLLGIEQPTAGDMVLLSEYSGYSEEEIQFSRLVENEDIFRENIKFLFSELPKEITQKKIADELGVSAVTISRWKVSSKQTPPIRTQKRLLRFLGISEETDLNSTPLFLSIGPVSIFAYRAWLKRMIDDLDIKEFQLLLPSLQKLLTSHENMT